MRGVSRAAAGKPFLSLRQTPTLSFCQRFSVNLRLMGKIKQLFENVCNPLLKLRTQICKLERKHLTQTACKTCALRAHFLSGGGVGCLRSILQICVRSFSEVLHRF